VNFRTVCSGTLLAIFVATAHFSLFPIEFEGSGGSAVASLLTFTMNAGFLN